MKKEVFEKRKQELIDKLNSFVVENDVIGNDKKDYVTILKILIDFSYENRLLKKGSIAHTIVDSLCINQSLGSKLIQFDRDIS